MGFFFTKEGLLSKINEDKKNLLKIVFTNGCFDLIHAGHIRYLRQAKGLGDRLIVAINSDNSVRRLKKNRPIINEDQRVEVLEAFWFVDYVTLFDEDTPYELIKYLRPHILVKGGDWKIEEIIGSDLVDETYSIKYHDGLSTSAIIDKIKKIFC